MEAQAERLKVLMEGLTKTTARLDETVTRNRERRKRSMLAYLQRLNLAGSADFAVLTAT